MRLASICLLLGGLISTAASAQNPRLVLRGAEQPPLQLMARLERADSGQPIAHATVWLLQLHPGAGPPDTLRAFTSAAGDVAFDSLRPGRYVLRTASINFRSRLDTIVLAHWPAPRLAVLLVPHLLHLGHRVPDSNMVLAARAQRDRWTCDKEAESIAAARATWLEYLARYPPTSRVALGLPPAPASDAQHLVQVPKQREWRMAADAYDRVEGADDLAFTVFRLGPLLLVSQAGRTDGAVAFDAKWRPVIGIVYE